VLLDGLLGVLTEQLIVEAPLRRQVGEVEAIERVQDLEVMLVAALDGREAHVVPAIVVAAVAEQRRVHGVLAHRVLPLRLVDPVEGTSGLDVARVSRRSAGERERDGEKDGEAGDHRAAAL
jgi:hypothetical protein